MSPSNKIKFVGGDALSTVNVASANLADLSGAANGAVGTAIGIAATNWDSAGDAILMNVAAGTGAGTYLLINSANDATWDAAADQFIKLVAIDGVLTSADIIA